MEILLKENFKDEISFFFFLFFFFFNQKNVPFWSSKEMVTFEGFDDKLHKNVIRGKISQHYSNAP